MGNIHRLLDEMERAPYRKEEESSNLTDLEKVVLAWPNLSEDKKRILAQIATVAT
jgi:hypothetical protein